MSGETGVTVDSDSHSDSFGVTAATVWSDDHVRMTYVRRKWGNSLHGTCVCIEQVIKFCLPGAHMLIFLDYQRAYEKWERMRQASQTGFAGVNMSEEWERWKRIADLIREVTQRCCVESYHPQFWEVTQRYLAAVIEELMRHQFQWLLAEGTSGGKPHETQKVLWNTEH
jgi:hypothetical protein